MDTVTEVKGDVAGRYSALTDEQKLALDSEAMIVAVKLEAIHRGVKPPLKLEDAIRKSELTGFSMPPEAVTYYQIYAPSQYSTPEPTGLAFTSLEAATRAIKGAIPIYEDGYGVEKRTKIGDPGKFEVRATWVSLSKPKYFSAGIEEFYQDDAEFDAIAEECSADLSAIRQREYDRLVNAQKRKEYLALAKGNLEIAQAFWAKAERTPFPRDELAKLEAAQ